MNRIALTEEDFTLLIKNNLKFKDLTFSNSDLLDLMRGDIVKIDDTLIILQDIGYDKISDILDKYRKK